jgi:hypothetical protein
MGELNKGGRRHLGSARSLQYWARLYCSSGGSRGGSSSVSIALRAGSLLVGAVTRTSRMKSRSSCPKNSIRRWRKASLLPPWISLRESGGTAWLSSTSSRNDGSSLSSQFLACPGSSGATSRIRLAGLFRRSESFTVAQTTLIASGPRSKRSCDASFSVNRVPFGRIGNRRSKMQTSARTRALRRSNRRGVGRAGWSRSICSSLVGDFSFEMRSRSSSTRRRTRVGLPVPNQPANDEDQNQRRSSSHCSVVGSEQRPKNAQRATSCMLYGSIRALRTPNSWRKERASLKPHSASSTAFGNRRRVSVLTCSPRRDQSVRYISSPAAVSTARSRIVLSTSPNPDRTMDC